MKIKNHLLGHTDRNSLLCFILKYNGLLFFVLIALWSSKVLSQPETKPLSFSIQAGVNAGLLSGGFGPSLSFHYALRTQKTMQLESMFFFDSHSGQTFTSGHTQKNLGTGLAAGFRFNIVRKNNWNPSLLLMTGAMYSSEETSRPYENKGISGLLSLGLANTFNRRHMLSTGLTAGENISALYIKYGLWF